MLLRRRDVLGVAGALTALPLARSGAEAAGVVRVGVLTDLSGIFSASAGKTSVACARQAVLDFSGSHSLDVEVIAADHQNKPDVGAAVARRWYDEGVDMIVDVPNSAIGLAVKDVAASKNRVYINTGGSVDELASSGCTPVSVHWGYNVTMLARSTASTVRTGSKTWFFISADNVFGKRVTQQTTDSVTAAGGQVLGSVSYPSPDTTDFSSYLIQAQSSKADVIAFASGGLDLVNCVKQAHEFGIVQQGQKLAAIFAILQVINSLGLETAQGLLATESFYWDLNDRTRAFMERIKPKLGGNYVSSEQAATYASTLHYLKAVASLGVAAAKANGAAVVERMKSMPTDDDCFGSLRIRSDGQAMTPAYLFRVKTPAESSGPWDLYKLISTLSGEECAPSVGTCTLAG